jgi:hypothetical protein
VEHLKSLLLQYRAVVLFASWQYHQHQQERKSLEIEEARIWLVLHHRRDAETARR